MAIIDLTQSGAAQRDSLQALVNSVGNLIQTRVDPENPIRSILFPAGREELVQREINRTLPVEDEARALTREVREQAALDTALPAEEAGQIAATQRRAEGAVAEGEMALAKVTQQEAGRRLQENRILFENFSPEEAAAVRELGERAGGAQNRLAFLENTLGADTLERLNQISPGFATDEANQMILGQALEDAQAQVSLLGTELQREGMTYIAERFARANPQERQWLSAALATGNPGQGIMQRALQQERFDFEERMIGLRHALASQPTELSPREAFLFKEDINAAQDTTLQRMREAAEVGDKDLFQGLAQRFNDQAETMFLLDPQAAINMASTASGFFGGVKDIEFQMGDITDALSEDVIASATMLAESGFSDEEMARFDEELRAVYDPATVDKIKNETMSLAMDISSEGFIQRMRDEGATMAAEVAKGNLAVSDEEIQQLEDQYSAALQQGDFQASGRLLRTIWGARIARLLSQAPALAGRARDAVRDVGVGLAEAAGGL